MKTFFEILSSKQKKKHKKTCQPPRDASLSPFSQSSGSQL